MRPLFAACALALLAPASVIAQKEAPPAGGTPKSFQVPPRRTFALPNGMAVSLVPYGNVPKATIRLVVQAGRVNEAADQVWLSDLMARLMQEGTATRSAEEIARAAAGMGGALEVSTGANVTTIGGEVLSEHGPKMVGLIADVARHPRFPASELPRLKTDLLRELSIEESTAADRVREVPGGALPEPPIWPSLPDRGDAARVHDGAGARVL